MLHSSLIPFQSKTHFNYLIDSCKVKYWNSFFAFSLGKLGSLLSLAKSTSRVWDMVYLKMFLVSLDLLNDLSADASVTGFVNNIINWQTFWWWSTTSIHKSEWVSLNYFSNSNKSIWNWYPQPPQPHKNQTKWKNKTNIKRLWIWGSSNKN